MKNLLPPAVFTIGHSSHSIETFLRLLNSHEITAICDVRSSPYSRVHPQFNKPHLKEWLRGAGVAYVFLGRELGARSKDPSCYYQGRVSYDRLAATPEFEIGLQRVCAGAERFRVALMCAEKEPLDCHRTILISRYLESKCGLSVCHVLGDGRLESHEESMKRLLRNLKIAGSDMFKSFSEIVDDAYRIQGEKIAYVDEQTEDVGRL